MPRVFTAKDLKFEPRKAAVPEYQWRTSPRLHELVGSKHITKFDVRSLDPGKFSFPYHFHRGAEELFVLLSGEATLRTPREFKRVAAGDLVFMEEGPEGAHQLFNHGKVPCVYVDVSVAVGPDVVEYPDSGKVGIDGKYHRASSAVDYYDGETDTTRHWPADVIVQGGKP